MGPSHRGIQSLVAAGKPVALALALALTLAACAAIDAPPRVAALLHDDWFAPAAGGTDAHAVFEMSDAMRRYAERELADPARAGPDRRRALIEAFTRAQGGLRLAYDAAVTRTASEAYAERAGNCLSLVILTASFAKYLDLPVQYQSVLADEDYSHRGDLFVAAGHVNIMLGSRANRIDGRGSSWLTIDFASPADIEQERSVPIDEQTVVAMFMNNRAAEALAAGRVREAYWWARDAVRADAGFAAGINTLGVVYQRAGHPAEAEQALRSVLALESDNVSALSNLALLLRAGGRRDEAARLEARLAALQPVPPLWYLDHGRQALERGDFTAARDLLLRELRRQPYQYEAHYLLARAYAALGDRVAAEQHLSAAAQSGPTRELQALYAGKLERLRGQAAR